MSVWTVKFCWHMTGLLSTINLMQRWYSGELESNLTLKACYRLVQWSVPYFKNSINGILSSISWQYLNTRKWDNVRSAKSKPPVTIEFVIYCVWFLSLYEGKHLKKIAQKILERDKSKVILTYSGGNLNMLLIFSLNIHIICLKNLNSSLKKFLH